jgi:hypothetical protein
MVIAKVYVLYRGNNILVTGKEFSKKKLPLRQA